MEQAVIVSGVWTPVESLDEVLNSLKRMVVSGHHSRKLGRGFYEYPAARDVRAVAA